MFFITCPAQELWKIRQLTTEEKNHELDHNQNFSPDDRWIVYDTRPNPSGIAQNQCIEKVNVENGKTKIVYQVEESNPFGPGVGAVSYHPQKNQVIFIHGLPNADPQKPYAGHRRLGRIVDESMGNDAYWMDSRDVTQPYTPGALRGGTHRHQWSADGNWIGFTYNDALMVDLEKKTGAIHDLRTLGVSKRLSPAVKVDTANSDENIQGSWFSVLLVKVVSDPQPGSGEISRAYSDWWVGKQGYLRADGTLQRARSFLGDLVSEKGEKVTEVFMVDVPENIDIPGKNGPLEGTDKTMPMPPKGATVKRLTFTEHRKFPGVATEPRHWVSSSMDGSYISFLAKDDSGIVQVFLVPTAGGESFQVSHHDTDVQSMVRWHPYQREFVYVCNQALYLGRLDGRGKAENPKKISPFFETKPFSPVYSRDGNRLAFNRYLDGYVQIFLAERP
ncbi:DUF3748 domain-containing protein [Cyclobacterium jeungdonense]|uniref:DUF3748 domain-containing protein n=1 Tax=Cyclobacterium jeungdonense TaxID=708087 RepID=A0ABT8C113_9BACT|nr:DUF3748 domain-containing protein [Cyclobacterium jeungdonense]MDN3686485.1 DUF3748 domain-containing protein [Cyclobacterium jeungdonense]